MYHSSDSDWAPFVFHVTWIDVICPMRRRPCQSLLGSLPLSLMFMRQLVFEAQPGNSQTHFNQGDRAHRCRKTSAMSHNSHTHGKLAKLLKQQMMQLFPQPLKIAVRASPRCWRCRPCIYGCTARPRGRFLTASVGTAGPRISPWLYCHPAQIASFINVELSRGSADTGAASPGHLNTSRQSKQTAEGSEGL